LFAYFVRLHHVELVCDGVVCSGCALGVDGVDEVVWLVCTVVGLQLQASAMPMRISVQLPKFAVLSLFIA
jgi:hypothetical protein